MPEKSASLHAPSCAKAVRPLGLIAISFASPLIKICDVSSSNHRRLPLGLGYPGPSDHLFFGPGRKEIGKKMRRPEKTHFCFRGLVFSLMILMTACAPAKKELPYEPLDRENIWRFREEGLASWYGEEYHGRKTANGEIYDMYAMTAAHRTLPFNAIVRVTNRENGKRSELRINDRGPFIPGRIIDLSKSGARALDILGTGTAKVSVEVIGFTGRGIPSLEGIFAIQVGAFVEKENALRLRDELQKKYSNVHIVLWESNVKRFYRVRLGSFRSEAEARRYGETLGKDNLSGFVVRED